MNLKIKMNQEDCDMIMHIIYLNMYEMQYFEDFFNLKELQIKLMSKRITYTHRSQQQKIISVNLNEFRSWKIMYNSIYHHLKYSSTVILFAHHEFFEILQRQCHALETQYFFEKNQRNDKAENR